MRVIKETLNAESRYKNNETDGRSEHHINQYIIKDEIGRGSFGAVHLAVDQYGKEYVSSLPNLHRCPTATATSILYFIW